MKKITELRQKIASKKEEVRGFLSENKVSEAETLMEEVRTLEKALKIQEELFEEERKEVTDKSNTEERGNKVNKDIEYRSISKMLTKQELSQEERASINVGNSGAILPQSFVNQVQVLTKGYPSLKLYTHVIPVTTNTGKMPLSKGSSTRKLAKLKSDTELVKEMVTTEPINYAVEDYGKIYPIENSVLEDAGVDFYNGLLAPDVAECSINSENEEIVAIVKESATSFPATDYKGIQKCLNTKIVPSLLPKTVIITNTDGYDYLDNLTDTTNKPLLSDSLAVEGGKKFKGREVIVLDSADLPPVTKDKKPFYVVNLYALIKFFDRKGYEIAISTEAGFTLNQTMARVVERFDVVKADDRACFYIEF